MNSENNKSLVHIRVVKHAIQGLYVVLDNNEPGIIRTREISWDNTEIEHWRENYPVNWDGYAYLISSKKGEAHELSLRFVDYDPWNDFFEGVNKDQELEGSVTGVFDYGIFIEIEQGITGLLHKTQIQQKTKLAPPEVFWFGDKVMVNIQDVDHERRQISFNLASPPDLACKKSSSEVYYLPGSTEVEQNIEQLFTSAFPRNRILVVEDEPAQSAAVCNWLRDFGQSVESSVTAEEAIKLLSKNEPDIVLVDVGLPGMLGTKFAKHVLAEHPTVEVVNMTDWARANEVDTELEEVQAQGGKLLYKPLLPEDLANYLLYHQDHGKFGKNIEQNAQSIHSKKINSKQDIHHLLSICRERLGMEAVFLFSLEPAHRRVGIVDRSGDININRNAISQLIYSPVRDVAEDEETLFNGEIGERKRFQYLLEFTPDVSACIGIPIPAKSSFKYALFAMDRHSKKFSNETKIYMEGIALAMSATLDQIALKEQAAQIQRTALMGILTSGMIHEINNLVSPLMYTSNHLRKGFSRFEQGNTSESENLKNEINNIERDIRQIINTVKIFGRIAKKPQVEILKVDEIIDNTLILLNHLRKRSKIKIHFDPPERIMLVRNQAVTLEQIVLNVALNAIQQTAEHRPEGGGAICIEIQLIEEDQEGATCRIFVFDNGPGIHTVLWEKIFEMGYSTRQDGSGIGLFVSRNLIEEIGGKVYVAKSHILYGSVFALEFPVKF